MISTYKRQLMMKWYPLKTWTNQNFPNLLIYQNKCSSIFDCLVENLDCQIGDFLNWKTFDRSNKIFEGK